MVTLDLSTDFIAFLEQNIWKIRMLWSKKQIINNSLRIDF